jgi:hypothetical protein
MAFAMVKTPFASEENPSKNLKSRELASKPAKMTQTTPD